LKPFSLNSNAVFTLTRPSASAIQQKIAAARFLPADTPHFLSIESGFIAAPLADRRLDPFAHDLSRTLIGKGPGAFAAAKQAFAQWVPFDLGWARVANPGVPIAVYQMVAVEVHSLALWTLNLSRITQILDTATRFGFVYATTQMHVEQGEERFLLEFNPATDDVWYLLEAVSRPRHPLARLGYPISRAFQHRFARQSHRRMQEVIQSRTL
jgi:uncharacterized protein (UPF0548 family)